MDFLLQLRSDPFGDSGILKVGEKEIVDIGHARSHSPLVQHPIQRYELPLKLTVLPVLRGIFEEESEKHFAKKVHFLYHLSRGQSSPKAEGSVEMGSLVPDVLCGISIAPQAPDEEGDELFEEMAQQPIVLLSSAVLPSSDHGPPPTDNLPLPVPQPSGQLQGSPLI
jgi:hypothetical protein